MTWLFGNSRPSRLFQLQQDAGAEFQLDRSTGDLDEVGGTLDAQVSAGGFHTPMHCRIPRARIRLLAAIIACAILLFTARAAQVQIVDGDTYRVLAARNRHQRSLIVPLRGVIRDRRGERLAWNEPAFALTMVPSQLPREESARTARFVEVATIAGVNPLDLEFVYAANIGRPFDAIPVLEALEYEAAMRLAVNTSRMEGFTLVTKNKRQYAPDAPAFSHVLGFTGPISAQELEEHASEDYRPIDDFGKSGVERSYEATLRGKPGKLVYEVDARGRQLAIASKEIPQAGTDITLSLDAAFQKFVTERLAATLERVHASRGSVVAIDPDTGELRALVSLPTYNNNDFIGGIEAERYAALLADPDQPLFPRAIAGEFPSGSIFKPFVAYAALAEGIVGEHTSFVSVGGVRVGQWFFPDWKAGGHGVTDVRRAIAESVNTYFYIVGGGLDQVTGLGVERMSTYASRFGFGAATGIDIPGEARGFLPSKEWKESAKGERWYVGDTYHYAIGQGDFLTTPLQMAVAISTIANGGYRVVPTVVEGNAKAQPLEELDDAALRIVREGMRQTVTQGSARSLSVLREAVAGKTGTAQTPGGKPFHSWFTGFGPYGDPSLTLVVLVEEGGESTQAAVPLARELFDWWFLYAGE